MARRREEWSWRQAVLRSELGPTTKLVLHTLACHMNDAGESCYPSIETLCRETSLSNRAVITHLRLAREAGWIGVRAGDLGGKKWAGHGYVIKWPGEDDGSEPGSPPPDEMAVNDVHHHHKKGSERRSPRSRRMAVNDVHRQCEMAVNDVHTSNTNNNNLQTLSNIPGLNSRAFARWEEYRCSIRKPLKPGSIPAAQRKLAAVGSEQAQMAAVEHSIAQGYIGLYAPKGGGNRQTFGEWHDELSRTITEVERERESIAGGAKRVD